MKGMILTGYFSEVVCRKEKGIFLRYPAVVFSGRRYCTLVLYVEFYFCSLKVSMKVSTFWESMAVKHWENCLKVPSGCTIKAVEICFYIDFDRKLLSFLWYFKKQMHIIQEYLMPTH